MLELTILILEADEIVEQIYKMPLNHGVSKY
jgi:hypothetical protein